MIIIRLKGYAIWFCLTYSTTGTCYGLETTTVMCSELGIAQVRTLGCVRIAFAHAVVLKTDVYLDIVWYSINFKQLTRPLSS